MPLFNANINLDRNQLQHAVIHSGSSKPDAAVGYTAVAGQLFYDTDTNQLQIYTGSSWEGLVTETVDNTTITTVTSILNTSLVVGRDSTDQIKFSTDNQIIFRVNGNDGVIFKGSGEIEATSLDISGDADIAGTLTLGTALAVAEGGTGATSFADKSVIITQDSGTDTLAAVAMSTNGQLLIGGTSGPAVAVPTGGDGLTVTVGDGSLEYDLDANLTTVTSIYNASLTVGGDAETMIDFGTSNEIKFKINNTEELQLTGTALVPIVDNGLDLGTSTLGFKHVYLANNADSNAGTNLTFNKDRNGNGSAGQDGDDIGQFHFHSFNDASTPEAIQYGRIRAEIDDASDGSEAGRMTLSVRAKDAIYNGLKIVGSDSTNGVVDVVLGNNAASTTTVAGNAVITGDLTVSGDTISANVGTLDVEDKNITLNKSAGDSSSTADGAGITIQDAVDASNDASILWTASSDTFTFSHNINATLATAAQGNITSLGTLTTLNVDNININGNTISSTNTNGDITITPNGTGEVNIAAGNLNYAGTAITTTGAELNLIAGGTARGTDAVGDGDGILINDGGTMKMTSVQTVRSYMLSSLTSVGTLVEGAIGQGFGAIDNSGDGVNVNAGDATIKTDTLTATVAIIPDASDGATLGSATKEWSDLYLADGAQILFGNDQDIAITHVADVGLTLSNENTTATTPFILTLESSEAAIASSDIIAGIEFKPTDSDGGDGALTSAGIFAIANTNEFSSSKNRAKLVFTVADSETAGFFEGGLTAANDMVLDHSGNLTIAGVVTATGITIGSAVITEAELEILDGASVTTAELNIMDGNTSATSTTIVDADRVVVNDNGTMKQVEVTDMSTYYQAEEAAAKEKVFILNATETGVASSDNITYDVTHSFNSRNVMVEVYRNGSNSGNYQTVYVDVTRHSADIVRIVFGSARTAGDYTAILRKIG